jgi:putative ABC transport system ATP-binding protein
MQQVPMIEVVDLYKRRFKVNGQAHDVLAGVHLAIKPGEVVALIGPSGTGKSTFLRLLNRLEDPDSGYIQFLDRDYRQIDPLELRRQIGLVAQKPFMFPGTVRDNLLIAVTDRSEVIPSDENLADVLEACVADADWLDQPARKLSVGQQQRVSLARVLLNRPRLLLLDEPTSSLDPETADDVLGRLTQYVVRSDASLLVVSHDHLLAKKHAGRILVLRDGLLTEDARVDSHA